MNIVVGNIALEPGEQTSMVLGIGTQPLSHDYEDSTYQAVQQYALTYDDRGMLTELVGEYGLGLAVVRRSEAKPSEYTFDFVAYERAVPLWRGTIDVEGGTDAPSVTRRPGSSGGAAARRAAARTSHATSP